jgi:antitoxin (DNA-binding transcriptional repressor) of toxin-antitoxin stability system
MATTEVEVHDLARRLDELVSLAAGGTEVIVTEGHVPRARLLPLPKGQQRSPGLHAGAIRAADDFDAPLPDAFWLGTP